MHEPVPFIIELGEILRIFRERAKLSKKDAADALGVVPKTITNYESGYTYPSYNRMKMMKKLYGPEFEAAMQLIEENEGRFKGSFSGSLQFRSPKQIYIDGDVRGIKCVKVKCGTGIVQRCRSKLGYINLNNWRVNEYLIEKWSHPTVYMIKQWLKNK